MKAGMGEAVRYFVAAIFGLLAILTAGLWIEVMLRGGAELSRNVSNEQAWGCLLLSFLALMAFGAAIGDRGQI